MTNGELLLHWLTHVREGSWASFRRAVSSVEVRDDETLSASWISSRLSEMAHVEFFVEGGSGWRTFAPLLGGLYGLPRAVVAGGRTPRLVAAIASSCEAEGCRIDVIETPDGPDRIQLAGPPEAIGRSARRTGLRYVRDFARTLCAALEPLTSALAAAVPAATSVNWSVRSFDLSALRWVEGLLHDTAYEYRPRHGLPRYYVRGPKQGLLMVDRRTSVYAAACMNRVALLTYDVGGRRLLVPKPAPLPHALARVGAACLGTPPVEARAHLIYAGVPSAIAGVLMTAAGQRPPEPRWLSEEGGAGC